jgi:hypothetical protein
MHNLIDDPGHADTRKKLDAMLRDWLKKAGDPFEMPAEAAPSITPT